MKISEETINRVRQHARFLYCLAPEFAQGRTQRVEFAAKDDGFVAQVYLGEMMVDEWTPELL